MEYPHEKFTKSFIEAFNFASHFHLGQTYGGSHKGEEIDYLHHVVSVAMEVIWILSSDSSLDADLAIQCALLHDVVEDTTATIELVCEHFGESVAAGVMALSKDKQLLKSDQIADSLERIRLQPKEIWIVKMADRITNLSSPPYYWKNKKICSYQQDAKLIYEVLHEANAILAQRLKEKIDGYLQFLR